MQSIPNLLIPVSFKERVSAVMTLQQAERFWTKVQICVHGDPCAACCWEWQAGRYPYGYGHVTISLKPRGHSFGFGAHRLSYLFTYGDIPAGRSICHTCDNPPCCNPSHLFGGSTQENYQDAIQKGRVPRGDQHHSRLHPERLARGVRNGAWTHPERVRRGEDNGNARLTEAQVLQIRALEGTMTLSAIARQFHVTHKTIWFILRRETWRHLLDPNMNTADTEENQS